MRVLSDEFEDVIAQLSDSFSGPETIATSLISNEITFDDARSSDGEAVTVTSQTIYPLLDSPDINLRRSANDRYIAGFQHFGSTLGNTLPTFVKQTAFQSRFRNYNSSLDASLFADNLTRDVFENAVGCAEEHISLWHRYWQQRKRALGLEIFTPADIWAPLSDDYPTFPYSDALDIISEALAPLGSSYVKAVREGCLNEGWVDAITRTHLSI